MKENNYKFIKTVENKFKKNENFIRHIGFSLDLI